MDAVRELAPARQAMRVGPTKLLCRVSAPIVDQHIFSTWHFNHDPVPLLPELVFKRGPPVTAIFLYENSILHAWQLVEAATFIIQKHKKLSHIPDIFVCTLSTFVDVPVLLRPRQTHPVGFRWCRSGILFPHSEAQLWPRPPYVKLYNNNQDGNLLLLDDRGRVRNQITSVGLQIQ